MSNDQLIVECYDKLYVNGKIMSRKYNARANTKLKDRICKATSFLDSSASATERIYCIKNGITAVPMCPETNTPLMFCKNKKEYRSKNLNTSKKLSTSTRKKLEETLQNKYRHQKECFAKKYLSGDYSVVSVENLKEFLTSTTRSIPSYLEIYHNEICSLIHYTDKTFLKFRSISDLNFGERRYLILHDMFEAPACYDNASKKATYVDAVRGYRRMTCNDARISYYTSNIKNDIEDQGFKILNSNEVKSLKNSTFKLQCAKCDIIIDRILTNARWKNIYCPGCYGNSGKSRYEEDITNCIREYRPDITVLNNVKDILSSGKELDIYIPDLNIAIEFNGVLWHSFGLTYPNNANQIKDKKYHINEKRIEASKHGIRIINIFENEWIEKQGIVKSMLANKIHSTGVDRIYARKCYIRELSLQEKRAFLVSNHIQGDDNSSIKLGLFYEDELVSCMTFGWRKITGTKCFELIRFCNKLNITVIGGASKMFKHFLKNYYKSGIITSYADLRYSDGNLYKQLGFNFMHDSQPNYFYTRDCMHLENRVAYQKHKLIDKLDTYNPNYTELQNMLANNYRVIYDCGNKVYQFTVDKL